jgi:hypothetical protein
MKAWVILILLMVITGNGIASDDDLLEDGRGVHRLIPVNAYEGDRDEDVVLPIKPQSKSHLHCCRTERGKAVLSSLGRITPSLAMATTGVILLELTKQQYLAAEVFQVWPFRFHFDKFFFPTAFLNPQRIDPFTAFSMLAWEAISITALWIPTTFVAIGECIMKKDLLNKNDSCFSNDSTNANAVKMRLIFKGLVITSLSIGGATCIILNYSSWSPLLNSTPKIMEQFNLTGAIELCNKLPNVGLSTQIDKSNYLSALCSPSLLKDMLIPSSNGLPWSYCERFISGLSMGNYVVLSLPILMIFLNLIYLVAWI